MKKNNYLLSKPINRYSQYGEDGVIEQIFSILKPKNPWCVEFGAWDGIAFSNTRNLVEQNWNAVLIEPNPRKFKTLQKNNQQYPNVHLLKEFITISGKNSLDNLLHNASVPKNFDLLSIDIDGNDYHIWSSVKKYQPKVVVIEFNKTIPPDVVYIQPADFSIKHGNSIKALVGLGKRKGYELIACTEENAFFVDKKYFSLFSVENNNIENLFNFQYGTRLFQLFDGTIKIVGTQKLLWSGIPFSEDDVQLVPKLFRRFPEGYINIFLLKVFTFWKKTLKSLF